MPRWMRLEIALLLRCILSLHYSLYHHHHQVHALSSINRRKAIAATAIAAIATLPSPAHAARGAAELDLEFYLRDLVGGNKPQGNIEASRLLPAGPPRIIQEPLLSLLMINPSLSTTTTTTNLSCAPVKALIETIRKDKSATTATMEQIQNDIIQRVESYRIRSSRSFYTAAPWREESISDQYYFDLTAYAFWRAAADLLPVYSTRDAFVRIMGRNLYSDMRQQGILKSAAPLLEANNNNSNPLTSSIPALHELLNQFKQYGFCTSYRLGEQQQQQQTGKGSRKSNSNDNLPIFDELDDEAFISAGASIDCLVTVQQPATLRASLQIANEQSRFIPDYIGPTVAALFEATCVNAKVTWEVFFVDPEYRPNPKDYFPSEELIQFSISKT